MTTYRLNNNVFEYSCAYVNYRALRRQFEKLSVEFSQHNQSLIEALTAEWVPVGVEFKTETKKATMPDISIWNMSCLVVNEKAKTELAPILEEFGELLPLENKFYLFNCLTSLSGDVVDPDKTSVLLENIDSAHIPKTLEFLPNKIVGKSIFKPGFALNTFLVCQDDFKKAVESANLNGLLFDENLAQMFPRKSD
ncbi:MAG: hypothetical protein KUG82_05935 [Pseudomonadales bacterium]|nr:hypothetical protein [Pseudomonadales bacterium]